jgi:hypothetical protein
MINALFQLPILSYFSAPRGVIPGLADWRRVRAAQLRAI